MNVEAIEDSEKDNETPVEVDMEVVVTDTEIIKKEENSLKKKTPKFESLDIKMLQRKNYTGKSLKEVYGRETKGKTFEMGLSPIVLLPTNSIGLDVTLQSPGVPVNRIMLVIGKPDQGKTTFSHAIGSVFIENGGDVILCETEESLDENYIGGFYKMEGNLKDNFKEILKHQIKTIEKQLKRKEKLNLSDLITNKLETRLQYTESLIDIGTDALSDPLYKEIGRQAEITWRMRNIIRQPTPKTLEDLEAQIADIHQKKSKADPTFSRPSLIIIDSISNLEPKEGIEVESSSDGKKMAVAGYLHRFSRRWAAKLSAANIAVLILGKQTSYIPKPFEFPTELDKTNMVGGEAMKYISNHIAVISGGWEKEKDNPELTYRPGNFKLLRSKSKGNPGKSKELKGGFRIYAQKDNTRMDFDTPFFEGVFKGNLFGIECSTSWVTIPPEYIPEEYEEYKTKKAQTKKAMEILSKSEPWRIRIYTEMGIAHQLV